MDKMRNKQDLNELVKAERKNGYKSLSKFLFYLNFIICSWHHRKNENKRNKQKNEYNIQR